MKLPPLLLFALLLFVRSSSSFMSPEERLEHAIDFVALTTLAVGPRAKSFALTLMQSYVRNANSRCPLYIVTEDVDYFDAKMEELEHDVRINFVPVEQDPSAPLVESDDPAERERQKLEHQRKKAAGIKEEGLANNVHMRVKLLKTRLLDFVPSNYEYILYVDSDMVIGQAIRPFLLHALSRMLNASIPPRPHTPPQQANKPTVLAVFPDIGLSEAPYHTGVMFLSRTKSRHLLSRWRLDIASGHYKRDQWALVKSVNTLHAKRRMSLLSTARDDRFFTFVNGDLFRSMEPYTFVHATMYRLTQPKRFGFDHDEARTYYFQVLHAPYLYDFLSDESKQFLEKKEKP